MPDMPAFIQDGYSVIRVIPAAPGLHPAVKFRFRPALVEERYQWLKQKDVDGEEEAARSAKLIKRHVEEWNAKLKDGKVAPLDESLIRRLHPNLVASMLNIILGYAPGDEAADVGN